MLHEPLHVWRWLALTSQGVGALGCLIQHCRPLYWHKRWSAHSLCPLHETERRRLQITSTPHSRHVSVSAFCVIEFKSVCTGISLMAITVQAGVSGSS